MRSFVISRRRRCSKRSENSCENYFFAFVSGVETPRFFRFDSTVIELRLCRISQHSRMIFSKIRAIVFCGSALGERRTVEGMILELLEATLEVCLPFGTFTLSAAVFQPSFQRFLLKMTIFRMIFHFEKGNEVAEERSIFFAGEIFVSRGFSKFLIDHLPNFQTFIPDVFLSLFLCFSSSFYFFFFLSH